MARKKLALIAFGGNALLPPGEAGEQHEQQLHAEALAVQLVKTLRRGYGLVLVHGNGPQVGNLLIRMEEAANKVPPYSLDVCVAKTEGSIGYMLSAALVNRIAAERMRRKVTTVLTHVLVSADDPAFRDPTKPIGPFYAAHRARYLAQVKGWKIVREGKSGYRRVVASPRPRSVFEVDAVRSLLQAGHVVIAGGGGGIPVWRDEQGVLHGVEAVIDKDRTSALLARELGADLFVILMGQDAVYLHFGEPKQRRLAQVTVSEVRQYMDEGHFPPGSMGPKIEAAAEFARRSGIPVLITSVDRLEAAMAGKAGTRVVADGKR